MKLRLFGLLLAVVGLCHAQTPAPPAPSPATVPAGEAAADATGDAPAGELARLATMMLGKNGGNQLFYLPTRDVPATPARWGADYEEVNFNSADGTELHGWFMPARGGSAKGTVVFSHGNAGSIGHHLSFVMWLVEARFNVMLYDYRGFGKSAGNVDRRGMLDDVTAAFEYIANRADVDASRLVSMGHSLGGAKSITALAERPVRGLRAVIIDGAFASYQSMARVFAGQLGANLVTDEWAPKDFVDRLAPVPLLVVHGSDDEVVPFSQGKLLFDNANEPKTLFEVKDGRHGDALARDQGAYRRKLIAWLDKILEG